MGPAIATLPMVLLLALATLACATPTRPDSPPPKAAAHPGDPMQKGAPGLLETLNQPGMLGEAYGYGGGGANGPFVQIDRAGIVRIEGIAVDRDRVEERVGRLLTAGKTDQLNVTSSILPIPPGLKQVFERAGARQIVTFPGADLLRKAIATRRQDVRGCYLSELAKNPGLAGRVAIQITLAPSGQVTHSSLAPSPPFAVTTPALSPTADCILQAAKRWSFPSADGISMVTHTFTLEPPAGHRAE